MLQKCLVKHKFVPHPTPGNTPAIFLMTNTYPGIDTICIILAENRSGTNMKTDIGKGHISSYILRNNTIHVIS